MWKFSHALKYAVRIWTTLPCPPYYYNIIVVRNKTTNSFKLLYQTNDCRSFKFLSHFNPLTPNDHYSGRTIPLTSKSCILYIHSTNIDTEYFKHGIHSPFFSLQNAVCFIILMYLVPVLFTFYIQGVLKLKKKNSCAKRLNFFQNRLPPVTELLFW